MNRSLRIGIYGHGVAFSGRSLETHALGGSETMCVQIAEALVKRGHSVTVLSLGGEECSVGGVSYLDYYTRRDYAIGCLEYDVFLVSRDYTKLAQNIRTKLLGLWCHDTLTDGPAFLESIYATDFVWCVSDYHKSLYHKKAKEAAPILHTTRNGIDLRLTQQARTETQGEKRLLQSFVYGSRPERGLLFLLEHVWPRILDKLPEAQLFLAGYTVESERLPEQVKRLHTACKRALNKAKNVTDFGGLTKKQWYKVLSSCQVMLYPTEFPEVSCLAAIEAQACGAAVITTDDFALPECVVDRRNLIQGQLHEPAYVDTFVERAVDVSEKWDDKREEHVRLRTLAATETTYNIDKRAEEWETFFWRLFETRATTHPRQIVQQLIYHSDLLAAKHIITQSTDVPLGYHEDQLAQINDLLAAQHSEPEQYANYVDTPDTNLTGLPSRMQRALDMIQVFVQEAKERPLAALKPQRSKPAINDHLIEAAQPFLTSNVERAPLRLLDIGCGGGRFLLGALKKFAGEVLPYGIDFSSLLLSSTAALLKEHGYLEARSHLVNADLPDYTPDFKFDIVFCGEWLEHQQDLYGMLDKVFSLVRPGGLVVFTVPSGPWESLSYGKTFTTDGREIRFHVSHFELRDVLELFREKPHQIVFDPLTVASTDGALLGNWVVGVTNEGGPIRKIDYERKFLTTRPYETVAATIICKDNEDTILSTLKSIEQHVDEIIVYDTGSTDRTLMLLQERPKVQIVHGEWHNDFSKARNAAISHVSPDTDWIFWADTDEQLVSGYRLRKYTHTSLYAGFIILQHHLSLDCEQAPDVPVRLFRHRRGYQFWGRVHEHPQPSLNECIEPTLIMPDVHIVHYGYVTEAQRRGKVQGRNLHLLLLDRQESPERYLGAILLARDLLQMVQWTMEARNSSELDSGMLKYLYEVLVLYTPFRHPQHAYHALVWPYYQRALELLGTQGYPTAMGQHPFAIFLKLDYNPETPPGKVWFASYQELREFTEHRIARLEDR